MAKKIFVTIAAFNERGSIGKVVKNLKRNGFKNIVVVDDGSSDNTYKEAKASKVNVLQHAVNRGQGAALQTGISYALDQNADFIVTFDADGQHQVKDVKKMLPLVKSGKYDVIFGSRFLKGSGKIPFSRKFLLFGSMVLQRVLWGIPLSDAHNGLRAMNKKAAEYLNITSDRMEHSSEIAEQLINAGFKYKEVPINVIYTKEMMKKGHGSFLEALRILVRYFIRKIMN